MCDLEEFLEERSKIPIPKGDAARVKLLAKELAMGYDKSLWQQIGEWVGSGAPHPTNSCLRRNFNSRWHIWNLGDSLDRLRHHGFSTVGQIHEELTQAAFDLLEETEPYTIFISYRRLDSSALALLVLARLKEHDLVPFVDMALEAGGKWHADLEARVKDCDYFIILLGKDTLSSDMTVREIRWAVENDRAIIPLWHSGFDIGDGKWANVGETVKDAIQQTNAIRVADESASGYNSAIVELLGRFDIMP